MCKLTLIRGLPGSGKSTLAQRLAEASWSNSSHYEADQFFMVDGVYKFDASKLAQAHATCLQRTDKDLEMGRYVLVSNTFTTWREMLPYFELAKKYCIIPQVILCQSGPYKSVHGVPEETIERMRQRFVYDIHQQFDNFFYKDLQ